MPSEDTGVQPSVQAQLTGQSWGALPQGNGSSDPNGTGERGPVRFLRLRSVPARRPLRQPGLRGPGRRGLRHQRRQRVRRSRRNRLVLRGAAVRHRSATPARRTAGRSRRPTRPSACPGRPGTAPTETGLPWPYDRPAPAGNGMSQPPAAAFGSDDTAYRTGNTYRPYSPGRFGLPPARRSVPAAGGVTAARRAVLPHRPSPRTPRPDRRLRSRPSARTQPPSRRATPPTPAPRPLSPAPISPAPISPGRAVLPGDRIVRRRRTGPRRSARRDLQGAAETRAAGQPGAAASRPGHLQQHGVGGLWGQRRQPFAGRHPQRAVGDAARLAAGTGPAIRAARTTLRRGATHRRKE